MKNINPQMVTLAREAAGLTQGALAQTAGISQAHVSKIEHGLDHPSDEVLESFARECSVPVEFFFQAEPVLGIGIVDFFHRKRQTLPAKPLRRAQALANKTRLESSRLLSTIELEDVQPFPVFPVGQHESPEEVASLVRATWRVPDGPLPNLVALVEAAGVPVLTFDLGHEKLSAISIPGLHGRHVVLLNSSMSASHQRFALAHELGHLVLHDGGLTDDIEREADRFASELLMPAKDIQSHLQGVRFSDLGPLKSVWRVSLAALIRRAHDLGGITDRQYRTFNMNLNKLPGGRKREPGEFPPDEPRLMRHVIDHLRSDLGYSIEDVGNAMCATSATVRSVYLGEPEVSLRPIGGGEPRTRLRLIQ